MLQITTKAGQLIMISVDVTFDQSLSLLKLFPGIAGLYSFRERVEILLIFSFVHPRSQEGRGGEGATVIYLATL